MRGLITLAVIISLVWSFNFIANKAGNPDPVIQYRMLAKYLKYMRKAETEDPAKYEQLVDSSGIYLQRCWRTGDSFVNRLFDEPVGVAWNRDPLCAEITRRWFDGTQPDVVVLQGRE